MGIRLVIGKVCAKALLSIIPVVVRALEFGGDSALLGRKKAGE